MTPSQAQAQTTASPVSHCGPMVNAFCPWTRGIDRCCQKDKDSATTKSLTGSCVPCYSTKAGSLWTYSDPGGWS